MKTDQEYLVMLSRAAQAALAVVIPLSPTPSFREIIRTIKRDAWKRGVTDSASVCTGLKINSCDVGFTSQHDCALALQKLAENTDGPDVGLAQDNTPEYVYKCAKCQRSFRLILDFLFHGC